MIAFLNFFFLFNPAGLAMGILNLAIVIPQVITFIDVFCRLWSVLCIFGVQYNCEQS